MKLTSVDKCPVCNSCDIYTIDSRMRTDGLNYRRRRKACSKCGYRFTTYEMLDDEFNKLIAENKFLQGIKKQLMQLSKEAVGEVEE